MVINFGLVENTSKIQYDKNKCGSGRDKKDGIKKEICKNNIKK